LKVQNYIITPKRFLIDLLVDYLLWQKFSPDSLDSYKVILRSTLRKYSLLYHKLCSFTAYESPFTILQFGLLAFLSVLKDHSDYYDSLTYYYIFSSSEESVYLKSEESCNCWRGYPLHQICSLANACSYFDSILAITLTYDWIILDSHNRLERVRNSLLWDSYFLLAILVIVVVEFKLIIYDLISQSQKIFAFLVKVYHCPPLRLTFVSFLWQLNCESSETPFLVMQYHRIY
jgi:hypothetical protein